MQGTENDKPELETIAEDNLLRFNRLTKTWISHYVVLNTNAILVYSQQDDVSLGTPKEIFTMSKVAVALGDMDDIKNHFNRRVYYIKCEYVCPNKKNPLLLGCYSEETRNSWVSYLLIPVAEYILSLPYRYAGGGHKKKRELFGQDNLFSSSASRFPPRSLSLNEELEEKSKGKHGGWLLNRLGRIRANSCPVEPACKESNTK